MSLCLSPSKTYTSSWGKKKNAGLSARKLNKPSGKNLHVWAFTTVAVVAALERQTLFMDFFFLFTSKQPQSDFHTFKPSNNLAWELEAFHRGSYKRCACLCLCVFSVASGWKANFPDWGRLRLSWKLSNEMGLTAKSSTWVSQTTWTGVECFQQTIQTHSNLKTET